MAFAPYIHFDGKAQEAFTFYAQVLGAPDDPAKADHMIHIHMEFPGGTLLGSDAPPQYYKPPQGFSLSVDAQDADEAARIFGALAMGGSVTMPLGETFWSPCFGMLTDRYGIGWMVGVQAAG